MSLWLDKHRPRTLEKLTIHDALTGRLHKIAESPQFPHLMFYGPAVRRASLDCLARVRRALVCLSNRPVESVTYRTAMAMQCSLRGLAAEKRCAAVDSHTKFSNKHPL